MPSSNKLLAGVAVVGLIIVIALTVYLVYIALQMKKSEDKDIRLHGNIFLGAAIANSILGLLVIGLTATGHMRKRIMVPINVLSFVMSLYIVYIGLKIRKNQKLSKHGSALIYLTVVPLLILKFERNQKAIDDFKLVQKLTKTDLFANLKDDLK